MNIVELDTINHVAFTDTGDILAIEDYCDEDENPCLPEDSRFVFVRTGSYSYKRIEIAEE